LSTQPGTEPVPSVVPVQPAPDFIVIDPWQLPPVGPLQLHEVQARVSSMPPNTSVRSV
jgi:hypothetical protein